MLISEGRELSDRKVGERRTYVEVSLEGSKSRTEHEAGANPQWMHESVHGVTDISNDIVVSLYQHHHLKKDEKIAHVSQRHGARCDVMHVWHMSGVCVCAVGLMSCRCACSPSMPGRDLPHSSHLHLTQPSLRHVHVQRLDRILPL